MRGTPGRGVGGEGRGVIKHTHTPYPFLCINLLRNGCGVHSSCRNIIIHKKGDCGDSLRNTQRTHCLNRFQFLHRTHSHIQEQFRLLSC